MEKNRFLTQWVVYSSLGILLGFGFAAITGLFIASFVGTGDISFSANSWLPALTMVFTGFVEGYILGIIQATPLHKAFPRIPPRDWAIYTGVGGAVAWGVGMLLGPLVTTDVLGNTNLLSVITGIAVFCLLTGILGFSQWFILRKLFDDSWKWTLA